MLRRQTCIEPEVRQSGSRIEAIREIFRVSYELYGDNLAYGYKRPAAAPASFALFASSPAT